MFGEWRRDATVYLFVLLPAGCRLLTDLRPLVTRRRPSHVAGVARRHRAVSPFARPPSGTAAAATGTAAANDAHQRRCTDDDAAIATAAVGKVEFRRRRRRRSHRRVGEATSTATQCVIAALNTLTKR